PHRVRPRDVGHGRRRRDREHRHRRVRPAARGGPDRVGCNRGSGRRKLISTLPATAGSVGGLEGGSRSAAPPRVILGVLSLGACAYTLLQSLVVPALPVLQRELHASTSGVAWVFTAYLLAASVVTPIAGRLGDMFGKKLVLMIALVGLAAGSLLAAV